MKTKHYSFTADPFGRAFVENDDKTVSEQIAMGLLESARYRPISFPDNCMLPTIGAMAENGASYYVFSTGVEASREEYDRLIEKYPENADDLREIADYMKCASKEFRGREIVTPYEKRIRDTNVFWAGGWIGHANPDYDRVLHLGTNGIRELIEKYRLQNPGKDSFYNASKICMDAVDIIGDRIRNTARENALVEADEKKRAEWKRIEKAFEKIPREGAYDMYSAVMLFWVFFTFDGTDSPGRLDQCMIDFYGRSTPEESEEVITRLLEGIHNIRAWNLCLSGSDENRNDETNELSYLILRKVTEMKYQTPNLTVRVHKNTPEKLWKMIAESLATGTGLPAIYNDEVVCDALEMIGIPPEDSHDYCMNGCNQIDIMGKSHMGLEDGEVNIAKALDFTLHRGVDSTTGNREIICRRFGNPRECESFDEFMSLYCKYLDYFTDMTVTLSNKYQEMYAAFQPNPMRSCTIQGCLEKGIDYKNGGPLYGHGQILLEGIADAADSLWAIKTVIYDKKLYTMDELIEALEDNYEGHEELYRVFSTQDKFGNDLGGVDELCAEVVDHVFKYLKTKSTYRGGVYTGGCSPFDRAACNGITTGALPNGKLRGSAAFADSIAATPGKDTHGPTASINSMLHYKQREACSGFVAQMKMTKSVFCAESGMNAFISLAKVYFAGGGQQLSVNVLDREALLRAREEPEKYKNLIVRVGGYSDYFGNLSRELQQNVIDRSEFEM